MPLNIIISIVIIAVVVALIYKKLKSNQNAKVVEDVVIDDKTYTLEKMIDYIKRKMDEITKVKKKKKQEVRIEEGFKRMYIW